MTWTVQQFYEGRWEVCCGGGGKWASFTPDQRGRVKRCMCLGVEIDWSLIQAAAKEAREATTIRRFGTRGSEARRMLCVSIAAILNREAAAS